MSFPRLPASLLATALAALTTLPASAEPAAPATAAPAPPRAADRDPRLDELMTRFEKAQEETETMTASFRQVKEDELFAEPTVLTGHFAFRHPDLFRWDYGSPEPVTVIATPDVVRQYIPAQSLLRETNISKKRRRAMNYLGIGSDVQNLRRHFDVSFVDDDTEHEGADKIELTGKNRRVRKRLALMEMWIDRETALPRAVRTTMADGGRTTWEFEDMKVNAQLPADTFELAPAPGTRIERGGRHYATVMDEILDEDDDAQDGDDPDAPAGEGAERSSAGTP